MSPATRTGIAHDPIGHPDQETEVLGLQDQRVNRFAWPATDTFGSVVASAAVPVL